MVHFPSTLLLRCQTPKTAGQPYWWNPETGETTNVNEPRPAGRFRDEAAEAAVAAGAAAQQQGAQPLAQQQQQQQQQQQAPRDRTYVYSFAGILAGMAAGWAAQYLD